MLVFEFDGGRKYIDEWAADGKPSLTRAQMRRVQSWKILAAVVVPPILLLIDYGSGETIMSPFQRRFQGWWRHFCALDSADVAKAYSGGWRPDPPDPSPKRASKRASARLRAAAADADADAVDARSVAVGARVGGLASEEVSVHTSILAGVNVRAP